MATLHLGPGIPLGPGGTHHAGIPLPPTFPPVPNSFMADRMRSPVFQAVMLQAQAQAHAEAQAQARAQAQRQAQVQAAAVAQAHAQTHQRQAPNHPRTPIPALVPVPALVPGVRGPFPRPYPGPLPPSASTPYGLMFSQDDLDMVLYGYARNKENDKHPGHALSGLRIGQLSHGIERILGTPSQKPTPHQPVDPVTVQTPEGLEIYQTTFAGTVQYGVFCTKTILPKGTKFGPFQGKLVNTSEIKTNDDNSFMWEIFQNGRLSHFVDGRGNTGSWMSFVNMARYAEEQNLIAFQEDGGIYYEVCKDVPRGTELLVWYGDAYLQFMGIPVAIKEMASRSQQEEAETDSKGFKCERCGKVFAYEYYRDKHLKYTRCVDQGDRKFPCHLCTRSFEKRDRLRIHILHVHEKHRPHKCNVCAKSFSQSSSLNKHMRVHSGERPYKCVYCSKAFTASSILRTHIRQHSGEKPFKCKHCGKAFASHAAHDSHVRRTHVRDKSVPPTNLDSKLFSAQARNNRLQFQPDMTAAGKLQSSLQLGTTPRYSPDGAIDVVNS